MFLLLKKKVWRWEERPEKQFHRSLLTAPLLRNERSERKRKWGLHSHCLSVDGSASTVASLLEQLHRTLSLFFIQKWLQKECTFQLNLARPGVTSSTMYLTIFNLAFYVHHIYLYISINFVRSVCFLHSCMYNKRTWGRIYFSFYFS